MFSVPAFRTRVHFPGLAPGSCCGVDREAFLSYSLANYSLVEIQGRSLGKTSRLVKLIWFIHRAHVDWGIVVDQGFKWCNLPWAELLGNLRLFTPDNKFFDHIATMLTVILATTLPAKVMIPDLRQAILRLTASGHAVPPVVLARAPDGTIVRQENIECERPVFYILYTGQVMVKDSVDIMDLPIARQLLWRKRSGYQYINDLLPMIGSQLTPDAVIHY